VILVDIKVSCAIYKLLIYNELFIIKRSTKTFVLQKVVMVINVMFKKFITWLVGEKMQVVMMDFKNWSGVPSMIDVIDDIHIAITKPFCASVKHYFSHNMWDCLGV